MRFDINIKLETSKDSKYLKVFHSQQPALDSIVCSNSTKNKIQNRSQVFFEWKSQWVTLLIHILKRAEGQWCPGVYICAWISKFFLINGKIFNKSARTIFLSKYVFPKKCENHSREEEEEKIHSRNQVLQWKVLFIWGSVSKKLRLSVSQWFTEKTQQMLYFQKRRGQGY